MEPTREPSGHDTEGTRSQPSPADSRQQMERILANPSLQASTRRRSLFRYLVEETLAGRTDRLKGYTIALAVFGRDENFDPQSDPVVRLEARRLRRDLDGYYAGAGSRDLLRISIPKGGYVPHFEWLGKGERSEGTLPDGTPVGSRGTTQPGVTAGGPPLAALETTVSSLVPKAIAGPDPPGRRRPAGLFGIAALTAILLLCAIGGAWLWLERREKTTEAMAHGPVVIVLPFEALSSGQDDRFLAAGLTQELITDLMRFGGFRLYSLEASFDANADPLALARSLEVSYVVKGSLRSDDGALRVGAQLVDAHSGQVLWSQSYDRKLSPRALLGVQGELAAGIASTLGQPYGIMNNDAANRLLGRAAPSMPTYACILRAFAYRRSFHAELYAPALACLRDSVRRDPNYAVAWAMMGWLHLDAIRFNRVPEAEFGAEFERAFSAAEHALALDQSSVIALQALSSINYYAGRHDDAERLLRQALALNPNDPDTLAQLGWRLAARGKWGEGIPYLERAIDRTVSPPGWYFYLISIHAYLQGSYAEALAAAERAMVDDSALSWSFVAIAQGALGNQRAARQALAEMAARSPLLARDPAGVFRRHQAIDPIVDGLVAGLRKAGWKEPGPPGSLSP